MDPQITADIERGRTDIVYFAWRFLGLTLHPGQMNFVRKASGSVNILVPGNRWGKTVTLAVRHIWHCFYKIGMSEGNKEAWTKAEYRTVALAPHSDILDTDYKVIKAIMTSSFVVSMEGEPIKTNDCALQWFLVPEACRNSAPYFIQFRDNAGIKFASTGEDKGTSVQGKKFGYGSYDEGGRSHHLEYELKSNLIPRFGEMNAPIDLASTPDQKSPSLAYHHDIFQKGLRGEEGFTSFEGSSMENLYLPKSYFAQIERTLKGDPIYDQVLHGKFVFAGDALFPKSDIDEARDDGLTLGVAPEKRHQYIIGVDTAIGEDEMVFTVLDVTSEPFQVVRQMAGKGNTRSPDVWSADFVALANSYMVEPNALRICLETWNGESVRFYKDLPMHLQVITKCWGSFTPEGTIRPPKGSRAAKKADIVIALRKVLATHRLKIPNEPELIKQLFQYREDDTKLRTDRVISLALACWLATDGKIKQQEIEVVGVVGW